MFFLPVIFLFFFFYILLLGLIFVFIQIGLITFAFERIGIPGDYVFTLLLFSLLGSMINIPVKRVTAVLESPGQIVSFFGWRFRVPISRQVNQTLIAVNVGGAVIPSLISLYLIFKFPQLLILDILSIAIVSLIVHRIARPVRGIGIVTPALLPPLIAAAVALFASPAHAPLIAYVSGTLGTLIGADLMNLKKIPELGAPVASIGGAGTFDGIFLTGIVAVVLTSL